MPSFGCRRACLPEKVKTYGQVGGLSGGRINIRIIRAGQGSDHEAIQSLRHRR